MNNSYDAPRQGYGGSPGLPSRNMPPPPRHQQSPSSGGRHAQPLTLQPTKAPDNTYTFRNLVAVSTQDFPASRDGNDLFLLINGQFVVSARPLDSFPRGSIGLSEPQRTWMRVALTDMLQAEFYDPFTQGGQAYIGSMDIEIGFASARKITETPYDQDDLARDIIKVCGMPHTAGTIY
jgi:vesicle-fusing ATPase